MERYHFHELYEMIFVLAGDVKFFVADQTYQVKSGSLLVFNHTDLHRSVSSSSTLYERIVLYFEPEEISGLSTSQTDLLGCFVDRPPDFSHCIQLKPDQIASLLKIVDKAALYQDKSFFGVDVYKKIVLAEVLLYVNEMYVSYSGIQQLKPDPDMKRILPLLRFIQEHLHEDLSLDRLARAFYMSKYHISHIFRKATGFTPNEYVVHRRIIKARELLKKRELSVQRVGEAVGFNNNSHFIRTFKALVGVPPKQYSLATPPRTDLQAEKIKQRSAESKR